MYKMNNDTLRIGLLLPYQGPIGLWGLSSEKCAQLAAAELNTYKGILGKEIELVPIDASGNPIEVANRTMSLIEEYDLGALVGMHTSDIRVELVNRLNGTIPFIYTPMYEGGENHLGVFMTGETPSNLLSSMFSWLFQNFEANSWYMIGNDYCWPRKTNELAKNILRDNGKVIQGETYLPFDYVNFDNELDQIEKMKPDVVFVTLLGQCSLQFNRQFGERGLDQNTLRYCCAIEENMLYGIGEKNTRNLFSTMGYHQHLKTESAKNFSRFYDATFGEEAPAVNQFASSCYDGIMLLSHLGERAGSLACPELEIAASENIRFMSSRGESSLQDRHVISKLHIVEAQGVDFVTIA
jgi:ABC-type branched-subunit amino acid transport system substrate-binding protein